MDDLSRAIGELQGTMRAVQSDVSEIKGDVKGLQQFKWRVAGGAAALAVILTAVVEAFSMFKQ